MSKIMKIKTSNNVNLKEWLHLRNQVFCKIPTYKRFQMSQKVLIESNLIESNLIESNLIEFQFNSI